jgi:hypothetical protein
MRAHIYACQLVGCGGWAHAHRRHQRGLSVGGGCALLHTHTLHHHAAQLPQSALPVHAPLPPPHSSVSTLQLHRGCSPSAGGGCHRAAQRCTQGLTAPSTSSRDRRACAPVEVGEAAVFATHTRCCPLPHAASRCTSSYVPHTTRLVQKHSTRVVRGSTHRPRPDTTRGGLEVHRELRRVAVHHIELTAWSNPTT